MQTSELIDGIYEAAVLPELWPGTLETIAGITRGVGGILFATDLVQTKWVASAAVQGHFDAFVRDGWMERNPRPRRLAAMKHSGFVHDLDTFTREELDQDPTYGHLRSIGLGWAAGTMFPMPSGDLVVFSFERKFALGPIEREVIETLDFLRPHLGRAALLAWRLGLRRAQAMADALETVGLPAAVVDGGGRLAAANGLLNGMIPDVIMDRRERLCLADRKADALLVHALDAFRQAQRAGVQSIPLPARDGRTPAIVHLVPVRGAARDVFLRGMAVLVVTPVDRSCVPSAEVIEGLFDLTAAEAKIARAIGEGRSLPEIAAATGAAYETVRTHTKAILTKTGLHRQAELAAMLAGSSLPVADS